MAINLLKTEILQRLVRNRETYDFEVPESGLFLISVTARCKNWIQNAGRLFNDDDLALDIDGVPFYEFLGKRREFNTSASWNGNELKNIRKTVYFIIPLAAKQHQLTFIIDGSPFVETIEIYQIQSDDSYVTLQEDFLPKLEAQLPMLRRQDEEQGKLFFDIAWKNIGVSEMSATPKIAGSAAPQLKIDGRAVKDWSNIQIANHDDIHFLEVRAKNDAGIKSIQFRLANIGFNRRARVALYQDLILGDRVHLRSAPDDSKDEAIIAELHNDDRLELLEERVLGQRVKDRSTIWHKVRYQDKDGYVFSSFVEIEGQERQRIIELIREKAKEARIDPDWAIALAGCESRYKVYAVSNADAKGIFQLTDDLITDLNNPSSRFYSPVSDPFAVSQNIAGGISYFRWLYREYYKKSGDRLTRSLVAYNAGPHHVPSDGRFDLKNYTGEPQRLVACFRKATKKKPRAAATAIAFLIVIGALGYGLLPAFKQEWKTTSEQNPTLAAADIHIAASGAEKIKKGGYKDGIYYDDIYEYRDPLTQGEEKLLISFTLDKVNKNLLFREGVSTVRLPLKRLELEKIFKVEEDWERDDMPDLDRAVEIMPGIFYFLLTSHGYCGSGGCTFAMYRYDVQRDILTLIDKKFWGAAHFFLSPKKDTLAIVRSAGGNCFSGGYLYLLDLATDKMTEVRDLTPGHVPSDINRLAWRDDSLMEIEIHESECPYPVIAKTFTYDIRTHEVKLLSERELPDP